MKRGVVHPKSTPERLDDLDFNFRKNIEWFSPLVEKAEKYGVKLLPGCAMGMQNPRHIVARVSFSLEIPELIARMKLLKEESERLYDCE